MTKWVRLQPGFYTLQGLSDGYIIQAYRDNDGTWTTQMANSEGQIVRVIGFCPTLKRAKYHGEKFASETFVTKKNFISGEEYQESIDTPYYCSPSSETYWSM